MDIFKKTQQKPEVWESKNYSILLERKELIFRGTNTRENVFVICGISNNKCQTEEMMDGSRELAGLNFLRIYSRSALKLKKKQEKGVTQTLTVEGHMYQGEDCQRIRK